MTLLISSLFYLFIIGILTLSALCKNDYAIGMIRFISNSLLIKTDNKVIKAYSLTWLTFLTYNLYASIFSIDNFFLIDENNVIFTFLFIMFNTIMMFVFALHEAGLRTIIRSIYQHGNSIFSNILNLVICCISLITNFVIKPFSLILRIVINIFIGYKFHEIFEHYTYGILILEVLGLVKFLMYFIQIYIIMLLSNKIYYFLVQERDVETVKN